MIEYLAPSFVYTVLKDAWGVWRRRRRSQPPPHSQAVEEWLLASDEAAIKALVPGEMFEDWETKKQTEDDLTHQLQKLAAQQLGVGEKPPSPSGIPASLRLAVQKAGNERNAAEVRIEQHISRELAKGKLISRGIPNEAPRTIMNRS